MKNNLRLIALFLLAAALVVAGGVLWLGGGDLFGRQQQASIYYDGNVTGLSVGAPVTFRGVALGQVGDIAIEVDPATLKSSVRVAVKLHLEELDLRGADGKPLPVAELVRKGLRARLASQSVVTGQKAVELDFAPASPLALRGPAGRPEIPALADRFGPLIEQVAQLPLRDTIDDFRGAVQDLRGTLHSVQGSLAGAQALMGDASTELKQTAADSRRTLVTATDAIERMQRDSAETLASFARLSDSSRQTVEQAQPELLQALASFRQASDSARLTLDRIADLAAPGAPLRSDLEGSVRDLSQAARSLRSLGEQLEDKPNALIFGKGRP